MNGSSRRGRGRLRQLSGPSPPPATPPRIPSSPAQHRRAWCTPCVLPAIGDSGPRGGSTAGQDAPRWTVSLGEAARRDRGGCAGPGRLGEHGERRRQWAAPRRLGRHAGRPGGPRGGRAHRRGERVHELLRERGACRACYWLTAHRSANRPALSPRLSVRRGRPPCCSSTYRTSERLWCSLSSAHTVTQGALSFYGLRKRVEIGTISDAVSVAAGTMKSSSWDSTARLACTIHSPSRQATWGPSADRFASLQDQSQQCSSAGSLLMH